MKGFLAGIIFTLIVLCVGGYYMVKKGYIDLRADQEPSSLERTLATAAIDASTERRAPDEKNPVQPTEENLVAGAKLFHDHCAGCHGDPHHTETVLGHSFYPPVPQFFKEAPDMPDNQNFYIIQHGVRWAAMPAWSKTLSQTEMWQLATLLSHLEKLPPDALKELQSPPAPIVVR
jgi:thiosulfate dehydrogenase